MNRSLTVLLSILLLLGLFVPGCNKYDKEKKNVVGANAVVNLTARIDSEPQGAVFTYGTKTITTPDSITMVEGEQVTGLFTAEGFVDSSYTINSGGDYYVKMRAVVAQDTTQDVPKMVVVKTIPEGAKVMKPSGMILVESTPDSFQINDGDLIHALIRKEGFIDTSSVFDTPGIYEFILQEVVVDTTTTPDTTITPTVSDSGAIPISSYPYGAWYEVNNSKGRVASGTTPTEGAEVVRVPLGDYVVLVGMPHYKTHSVNVQIQYKNHTVPVSPWLIHNDDNENPDTEPENLSGNLHYDLTTRRLTLTGVVFNSYNILKLWSKNETRTITGISDGYSIVVESGFEAANFAFADEADKWYYDPERNGCVITPDGAKWTNGWFWFWKDDNGDDPGGDDPGEFVPGPQGSILTQSIDGHLYVWGTAVGQTEDYYQWVVMNGGSSDMIIIKLDTVNMVNGKYPIPYKYFNSDHTRFSLAFGPTNPDLDKKVWLWFRDGTGRNGQYPEMLSGTYPDITNPNTWIGFDRVDPIVPDPSIADFTGDPTSGTKPHDVSFTDQSTGDINTWYWEFGDGNTSSDEDPTHTYTDAGIYSVSLTVSGPGGSDTITKTDYITVSDPASVFKTGFVFSVTPESANESIVVINGTTHKVASGDTTETAAGAYGYTVSAPGYDQAKGSFTVVQDQVVLVPVSLQESTDPLIADFEADVTTGIAPQTVNFTDLTSGSVSTWDWDFGDTKSSSNQNPSHTYMNPGVYTVSLTVSGNGSSDTETKIDYIVISDAPSTDSWVKIVVDPDNCNIEVDGTPFPEGVSIIEVGSHSITVSKSGYLTQTQPFSTVAGDTTDVVITLEPESTENLKVDYLGNGIVRLSGDGHENWLGMELYDPNQNETTGWIVNHWVKGTNEGSYTEFLIPDVRLDHCVIWTDCTPGLQGSGGDGILPRFEDWENLEKGAGIAKINLSPGYFVVTP